MGESVVMVLGTLEQDAYSALVKGGNIFGSYYVRQENVTHSLHNAKCAALTTGTEQQVRYKS
jgi:hypothetical protein